MLAVANLERGPDFSSKIQAMRRKASQASPVPSLAHREQRPQKIVCIILCPDNTAVAASVLNANPSFAKATTRRRTTELPASVQMKNDSTSDFDGRPMRKVSRQHGILDRALEWMRQLFNESQRRLSLNTQRAFMLLFLVLQASLIASYLVSERTRIQNDAVDVLRNTALLEAQQFQTSIDAMRYQVRVIGNAILLNRTVVLRDVEPFLASEIERDWLDAVIVFNQDGNFVARDSNFPLEKALDASVLERASFGERPLFKELLREDATDRLFFWRGAGTDPNIKGFVVYRAIRDAMGRYLGGAIGYFDATTMAKLFLRLESQGFNLGRAGAMAILDPTSGMQLARMGAGAAAVRSYRRDLVSALTSLSSDSAQVHRYVSPLDGVRRLGVFLNLNQRKWVLAVGLAEREVLRDWQQRAVLATLTFLFMALLQWLLLHHAHTSFLQRERLARESRHDPLTGLANRRHFDEWVRSAHSFARRHRQPLCLLSFDLDHFKRINDTYGHDCGDAVLQRVAAALRGSLRASDLAVRFGGEEFIVALPQTGLDVALRVAERIRANFAAQEVRFQGQSIRFTASFGLVRVTDDELEVSEAIRAALTRADQALYQSKRGGRNRVTVAGSAAYSESRPELHGDNCIQGSVGDCCGDGTMPGDRPPARNCALTRYCRFASSLSS